MIPRLPSQISQRVFAAAAVLALTLINVAGVKQGKWTQNLLTMVKALGLLAIVAAALAAPGGRQAPAETEPLPTSLALIFVLFTYGGWNEMAYVAAEVKNPGKNIVRALLSGMAAVLVLYLLVNGAFLYTLGYEGLAASKAVAPTPSQRSCDHRNQTHQCPDLYLRLGAVNGLIFTGARISYALGSDYRFFRRLGSWDRQRGTPLPALVVQGLIALCMVLAFGHYIDAILYTAAAVYAFYMALACP